MAKDNFEYWVGTFGACAITIIGTLIGYGKCQEKYEKIIRESISPKIEFRDVDNDGLEDVVIDVNNIDKRVYFGR